MASSYSGSWLLSGTTATYTIKDGTDTVATITVTGLKDGVTSSALTFAFTDDTDFTKGGTIDLKAAALGTTKVTMTAKDASGTAIKEKYKLTLGSDVPKEDVAEKDIWEAAKPSSSATTATAVFKRVKPAYYKANGTGSEVAYTAQDTKATYATITGLSLDLLKDDANFSTLFTVTKYEPAGEGTEEKVGEIAVDDSALTKKNVKLTAGKDTAGKAVKYELSSTADAPATYDATWSVSSGSVLLKASISKPGYVLSEDGSQLSYIAQNDSPQTIAKITGLNTSGLKTDDGKFGKNYTDANDQTKFEECLSYEGGTVKILSTRVLNKNASTKVAFSTNLLGAKFDVTAVPHEKLDPLDAWVADATTPTTYYYKNFTPAYYNHDAATKTVSYVAPVDSKTTGKSSKAIVYATVKGLQSGLLGDADYVEAKDFEDLGVKIEIASSAGTITISKADVLNKKTVEVVEGIAADGTKIANKLELDFEEGEAGAPTLVYGSTPTWSKVSDGKFKLTANFTDGYALKGGKIEYIKAKNNVTIATIEGLDSSLTANDVTTAFGTTLSQEDETEFELTSTLLGGKDVVLTMGTDVTANYGIDCNLTLDDDDIPTTAETVPQWVLEGTTDKTAKYYAGAKSEYYALDIAADSTATSAKKIKYNAAALGNETVKVTGLNKDLVVDATDLTKVGIYDDNEQFVEALSISDTTVTVKAGALADKTVQITGTGGKLSYTPSTEADSDDPPIAATYNYELEHKASDGSATLKRGTNAYYAVTDTKLEYKKAVAPAAVAKIKGLNKDLEYDVDDTTEGKLVLGYYEKETDTDLKSLVEFTTPADLTTGAKTITIVDAAVLNGETVKFDSNSGTYKLALDEDVDIAPKSGQNLWYDESTKSSKISKFTYYNNCTSAGYNLKEGGSELTYVDAAKTTGQDSGNSTQVVTVVGLDVTVKDGKLVDKDGNVIGKGETEFTDPVDTSEKTVTLGINALGASDVYFYGDYSEDFTFVLKNGDGDDVDADKPFVNGTPKTTWTVKSGTVTYQYDIPATYELNAGDPGTSASAAADEDEDEEAETKKYLDASKYIRYTKPATVKATITGLSESKAKLNTEGNAVDGVTVSTEEGEVATAATAELKTSDGKIIFDATEAVPGKFTIAESLFNGKEIKVTSGNKAFSYTLDAEPLAADSNVLINDSIEPKWNTDNIKSGTVTYEKSVDKKKYVVDGSDKIAYYSDKKVISTLATIKGLSKDLKATDFATPPTIKNYTAENAEATTDDEVAYRTIEMTEALLKDSSKVTLTSGKDGAKATNYQFVLAEDITGPTDQYPKWVTKSGTATYQYQTTDGYTIGDASKTSKNTLITYSSEKWTPIFVVSGLSKLENDYTIEAKTVGGETYGPLDTLDDVYGIELTVDADDNAVVNVTGDTGLTSSDIKLSNKIKEADWNKAVATEGSWAWLIASGKDAEGDAASYGALPSVQFTLGVADELNPESRSYTEQWAYNNGTATLTNGTYAGYELGTADKTSGKYFTVKYVKPKIDETIATISGLPKPTDKTAKPYYAIDEEGKICVADSETGEATDKEAFTYDSSNGTITFTEAGLANATGTIKVKEKNIKLTVDNDAQVQHVENNGEGAWSIDNGKATLNRTVSKAGYKASSDGLSISYVPDKDKKGNATVETLATITGLNKNLTLKTVVTDVENGTIEIQDAAGNAVTGVTSLDSYISRPDQSDQTNFKVTLFKDVLGTSAIKITGTDKNTPYSLALDEGVQAEEPAATDHWEISGNKATYLNSVGAYYELVENTKTALTDNVKYHAPGKPLQTYFTITGLNKSANLTGAVDGGSGSEDGDLVLNNSTNVITLSQNVFDESATNAKEGTKVSLAIDKKIDTKYTLALASDVTAAATADAWSDANKGKSTLNRTISTAGYVVSSDAKNITYGTTSKSTLLATLNGVKEAPSGTQSDKKISIGESQVNGSKVTLKDNIGGGYYLALDTGLAPEVTLADERTDSLKTEYAWSAPKNGKVSLMGRVTKAGYAQSDNYNISYTAAIGKTDTDIAKAKDKALATITGIKTSIKEAKDVQSTVTGSVVTIEAEDLASKAVTVDGGGIISFDLGIIPRVTVTGGAKDDTITAGGTGVSISALAGNDSISVSGSNVSVNAGAGNDYIDIGNGASATIIYAKGNGNDIITGGSSENVTFSITGATTTTVDFGEDDTVINVDKNTITLKDYTGAVKIGSKTYARPASEDLLLDDNYSMTAANDLSSIIKADTGSYSPYQFSDALKLTKEESFTPQIAYGINKK